MADWYHKLLKRISHFQVEHPYLVLALLLAFTIAIYGGVSQVRTVASLEQMMPRDVEEIKAFNMLRDNHLGQDMIAVVLEVDRDSVDPNGVIDVQDRRVYEYLAHIQGLIGQETDVIATYSYADFIRDDPREYGAVFTDPSVSEQVSRFINDDRTATILLATSDVSADDPRMQLLALKIKQDIESAGHPPGLKVKFTGTPIVQQKLSELIQADRANTQWISTALVFLIVLLVFGTLSSAVLPILIVTISINWLYGTMGYGNLPISTLAGGVAAMVIGIGIDFTIHIMNKFRYERKKGLSIKQSTELAVVETGTALTASSITTIVAFLAFLLGVMPEMGRFGTLMAIGIAYSLFFSLFGLPALLVIEEDLIGKLKKRLHFGLEGELHLEKRRGR